MAQVTIGLRDLKVDLISLFEPRREVETIHTFGAQFLVPGRWIWGRCCFRTDGKDGLDTGVEAVLLDDSGKRWRIVIEQISIVARDPNDIHGLIQAVILHGD